MFSCVGKSVALLQLRIVTAKIMRNFNFRWPEVSGSGDSVADKVVRKDMLEKVMRNARDTFTITMGDMEMIFEERKV